MKKRVLLILLSILSTITIAQSHEAGVFVGGSNFIGDIGRTNYIYPNKIAGGLVYKFNINPRIAIRGNYTYLPTYGDDTKSDNSFRKTRAKSFSNSINEFAVGTEINFFDYNIGNYKTRYSPYIFTQVAIFNYKSPADIASSNEIIHDNDFSCALPFGLGIKGLLFDNFAFAFEIGVRYTFADDIDYTTTKINRLNFGGNGNDLYTFTGLSVVYTFGKPHCYSGLIK